MSTLSASPAHKRKLSPSSGNSSSTSNIHTSVSKKIELDEEIVKKIFDEEPLIENIKGNRENGL
jgi:hypothetical protein